MAFPPQHSFMFHSSNEEDATHHLPFPSSSCPPDHLFRPGGEGGGHLMMMRRSTSFSGMEKGEEMQGGSEHHQEELSDDGWQVGEKKKRLSMEQVKALEKSFELGNKLEPERKMELAKSLGLQPRQISIWFQNRRARWKTKQLERDYEVLKKQFDALKSDNDALLSQNKKLHAQLLALKSRESNEVNVNLKKENNEGSWSNGSDENSCDVNYKMSRTPLTATATTTTIPISSQLISNYKDHMILSSTSTRPTNMMTTQLLQGSSRSSSSLHLSCLKGDHHQDPDDQNFCSMYNMNGNVDEQQQGFWGWSTDHHAPFSLINQAQFSNNLTPTIPPH